MDMKNISRRDFLKVSAVTAAGLTIVPGSVLGKPFGFTAPSDKLNIAGIGIGGVGRRNLKNMSTENIIALCDIDWTYADKTFKDYPNAKRFKDWRVMFDQIGKSIDAVLVATPDHSHAVVTAHEATRCIKRLRLSTSFRKIKPGFRSHKMVNSLCQCKCHIRNKKKRSRERLLSSSSIYLGSSRPNNSCL